jgi:membrane carboxypeptidase/penicillin-binding protein
MGKAGSGTPPDEFEIPSGITIVEVDPDSGLLAGPKCENRIVEVFLEGTAPEEVCGIHEEE